MKFTANKQAIKRLPKNKQELANSLVNKLEFMEAELVKLQDSIKESGWTEVYQHGRDQGGVKASAESQAYNSLIKNYNTLVRTLNDMIPDTPEEIDPTEAEFFQ